MTFVPATFGSRRTWSLSRKGSALNGHEKVEWMVREVLGPDAMSPDGCVYHPSLPYDLGHLEPHYRSDQLEAHHRLHGQRVGLLNRMLHRCRRRHPYLDRSLWRMLTSAGSEHVLHCLFWRCLCQPSSEAGPELEAAMVKEFGSPLVVERYLIALCDAMPGQGWAVLGYDVGQDKLVMFFTGEVVNLLAWPVAPLLVCDLWEHAYQGQYGQDRGRWVEAFLRIANWDEATRCYHRACRLRQEMLHP
jgi:Fe-Mn family superoxide dismutase